MSPGQAFRVILAASSITLIGILVVTPPGLTAQEVQKLPVLAIKHRRPGPIQPTPLQAPCTPTEAAHAQQNWAKYLKVSWRVQDKAGYTLVLIPAGEFDMGSTPAERDRFVRWYSAKLDWMNDETQHRVRITQSFYLAAHEVTRGQFRKFVEDTAYQTEAAKDGQGGFGWSEEKGKFEGRNSKYHWKNTGFLQTDDHPVVNVSWNDAQAYCKWLSAKEGHIYRLPTEAEWEYSCRAGAATAYFFGDDPERMIQYGNTADETAKEKLTNYPYWTYLRGKDGFVFTSTGGAFQGNAFGLFDMHGNVSEWCHDWYGKQYYDSFAGRTAVNPQGDERVRKHRVLRGGSWSLTPHGVRSASRGGGSPDRRDGALGFRVARNVS